MKKDKPKYQQIIEAAIVVIAKNGYHTSKVSEIAKQAGVADGTIYLYFNNKEDLLVSVFKERMKQFTDKIVQNINKQKNANDKLLTLITLHLQQLDIDRNLAVVTQLELRQSQKNLRLQINNVVKSYLKVIEQIVIEGQQENLYRSDLSLPLIRQMIFGTIDETVTTWVMQDHKYDLPSYASEIHTLLTNGLSIIH